MDEDTAMSRAAKIVLGILGVFLLVGIGVAGLGVYWWSRHGRQLLVVATDQYDQGQAFGHESDEAGCLEQALRRYKDSGGTATGSIGASVFARACWNASRPTPGFCDAVPKPLDLLHAARWQVEQSRKAGVDEQYGGQIFAAQRTYCDARGRGAAPTAR
jgi:hypothetical protein